jgi:hypothetical protein
LIVIALLTFLQYSNAQIPREIMGNQQRIMIPFSYTQGLIVVDVQFQFLFTLRFIVDTGARHTILFNKTIAEIAKLNFGKEVKLLGADISDDVIAYVGKGAKIKLENSDVVSTDILVLEYDYLNFRQILGEEIHGILGGSFFNGLIVDLDYRKNRIILSLPELLEEKDLKDYRQVAAQFIDKKPFIKGATILDGEKVEDLVLLFDTGAALPIMLHTNTHEKLAVPENVFPGILGKGLGGELYGYIGRIESVTIDNYYEFNDPISFFQEISELMMKDRRILREGLIGNYIISRFDVKIDYSQNRLFLKPNKNFSKSFEYDKSGLSILAYGMNLREYVISDAVPGSPAHEAGLQRGDKIIKFGIFPSNFFSLSTINNKLSAKEGKKIKLKVLRDGEEMKFTFYLRDFLGGRSEGK